ncbi:MAG: hypothetical protein ACK5MD_06360 [Flavobacteriales bacterium]
MILSVSCNAQNEKDYVNNFSHKSVEYNSLVKFLIENKQEFLNPDCNKMSLSLREQCEAGCFPTMQDSLNYYLDMDIFQTIEFYQDKSIEFLLNVEANSKSDFERKYYFVYVLVDKLPAIYKNSKVHKELSPHWWYIETEDAYY